MRKKQVRVYITCMLCGKKIKCKLRESVVECARRYEMEKIKIKDIIGFVCKKCYYNKLFK